MQRNSAKALQKSEFLKPEIIAKISRLGFTKKFLCEGTVSGRHASPYRGYSSEFLAFRPYTQGDDIRYLDWKIFGRSEKFYIRQFEQETNMRACIVFDKSASMDFRSSGISKIDYAKILASTISYILIKKGDSVGFSSVADEVEEFLPNSRSTKSLSNLLKTISGIKASGGTNITGSLKELGAGIRRRSLIILISDLLTETSAVMKAIKNFIHQKHSFVVFQVLDPLEFNLPRGDRFLFTDKETREKIAINVRKSAQIYRRQFQKFLEGIENSLKNCGAGYFRFNTGVRAELEIPEGLYRTGFSVR